MADDPKRGRPRIDAPNRTVPVSVRVPSRQYEQVCQQARRGAVSVSVVIRQALQKRIAE